MFTRLYLIVLVVCALVSCGGNSNPTPGNLAGVETAGQ